MYCLLINFICLLFVLFGIPGFRDPVMPQIRDKITTNIWNIQGFFEKNQIYLMFF